VLGLTYPPLVRPNGQQGKTALSVRYCCKRRILSFCQLWLPIWLPIRRQCDRPNLTASFPIFRGSLKKVGGCPAADASLSLRFSVSAFREIPIRPTPFDRPPAGVRNSKGRHRRRASFPEYHLSTETPSLPKSLDRLSLIGPGCVKTSCLFWKVEFPSQFSHEPTKTEKTIFDGFRRSTFSHGLGPQQKHLRTLEVSAYWD
jgi:hypothetical protein